MNTVSVIGDPNMTTTCLNNIGFEDCVLRNDDGSINIAAYGSIARGQRVAALDGAVRTAIAPRFRRYRRLPGTARNIRRCEMHRQGGADRRVLWIDIR